MWTELAINGLVQGSLLALICIGYSLAYGSAKVMNFAHADVMIAGGGYLVLLWIDDSQGGESSPIIASGMALIFGSAAALGAHYLVPMRLKDRWFHIVIAILAAIVVGSITFACAGRLSFIYAACLAIPWTGLMAVAVYRLAYLPLIRRDAPRTSVLVAALSMSIAVQSVMHIVWGSQPRVFPWQRVPNCLLARALPSGCGFCDSVTQYGVIPLWSGTALPVLDVLIVTLFIVVAAGLAIFFRFCRLADAIVAAADSPNAAASCGIVADRVTACAFFIGGLVAAAGGTLFILRARSLDPAMGFSIGLLAFVGCVVGGIGSLRGSIIGAFIISLTISFAPGLRIEEWLSQCIPTNVLEHLPSLKLHDWSYGLAYLLLIITILFKRKGLFVR